MKHWKVARMVKDTTDLSNLVAYFKTNFSFLKNQYLYICATNRFPFIDMISFTNYTRRCNFISPNLQQTDIDRQFIASNVELGLLPKSEDNPDKSLLRYEWFEILVRIANEKYKRHKEAETFVGALEMLVDENVGPYRNDEEW